MTEPVELTSHAISSIYNTLSRSMQHFLQPHSERGQSAAVQQQVSKISVMLMQPIGEEARSQKTHGTAHWRTVIVRIVHAHWVQVALLLLLMVDVIALVAELLLDAEFPVRRTTYCLVCNNRCVTLVFA